MVFEVVVLVFCVDGFIFLEVNFWEIRGIFFSLG